MDDRPLRWVVTGTPCSGTMWVAEMLTRAGLPTAHEMRFAPGRVSSEGPFWGESSSFAPFYFDELDEDVVLVHLLRNPFATVRCMMNKEVLEDSMFADTVINVAGVPMETRADRYASFWVGWNIMIQAQAMMQRRWVKWHLGEIGVPEVTTFAHEMGIEPDPWAVADAVKLDPMNSSSGDPEDELSPYFEGMLSEPMF